MKEAIIVAKSDDTLNIGAIDFPKIATYNTQISYFIGGYYA
jgi:hypothetical protein